MIRIKEIDGLRGLAIVLVLCYHFLYRFDGYYPYATYNGFISKYGYMGVDLFFIVSGFVFLMTIENCRNIYDFMQKRLMRLYPPLIFWSITTFIFMWTFTNNFTIDRRVGLIGFIPTLSFTDPALWKWLSNEISYIDGVYWSLFVEIKFYIIASALYFLFRKKFLTAFSVFALFSHLLYIFFDEFEISFARRALSLSVSAEFMPLFLSGIFFYKYKTEKKFNFIVAAIFSLMIFCSKFRSDQIEVAYISIFCLFFCFICIANRQIKFLDRGPLQFIGKSSYSLYLSHQNIGMCLIASIPISMSSERTYMASLFIISGIVFLSWISYLKIEIDATKKIRGYIENYRMRSMR